MTSNGLPSDATKPIRSESHEPVGAAADADWIAGYVYLSMIGMGLGLLLLVSAI